jgi:hypothetical protein
LEQRRWWAVENDEEKSIRSSPFSLGELGAQWKPDASNPWENFYLTLGLVCKGKISDLVLELKDWLRCWRLSSSRASGSNVDRIARRNHFTRERLGEGESGMVRYLRKEVEEYEASRRVEMN